MRDYDLQINGADHLVAKRSGSSPEDKTKKEKKTDRKTALEIDNPERKSVYDPNKQDRGVEGEREREKKGQS
jgi:hypothetical protein